MRLDPLTPGEVIDQWPHIMGFVLQMERRFPDDWNVPHFIAQVEQKLLKAWIAHDDGQTYALVGTELRLKPSGRLFLMVTFAAGKEHNRWTKGGMATLEEYAREQGCSTVEVYGRSGWRAALPDYQRLQIDILRKELGSG
jgi:hypothetical protein